MQELDNDLRVFERFSARFPVRFKHTKDEYGTTLFMRDASAQGARITTRHRVFLNDSVSIEVSLPDGLTPMTLSGKIVWVKNKAPNLWEAGLEFHKVNLMEMNRIYKLVQVH